MGTFTSGLVRGVLVAGMALAALSFAFPARVELSSPNAGDKTPPAAAPKPPAAPEPAAPQTPPENAPIPAEPSADKGKVTATETAPPPANDDAAKVPAVPETTPAPAANSGTIAANDTAAAPSTTATTPAPASDDVATAPTRPVAKIVHLGNSSALAEPSPAAEIQAPLQAPPLQAFAAEFTPEPNKPLFAVILQDVGDAGVDRAIAASLPYPVTFAIDPESPFAAEAMTLYRAAGKEVIILPAALPAGANASDVELNLSSYAQMLPESLAFISGPQDGFQDDLALSKLVIPTIGAQGRGVVLLDKGLNSAQKIAQREGIAYALVSKIIDAEGESVPVMRRYLDRAVFKAAQDGSTAVMGTLRPDTLTALTEWTLEGNASAVSLAPISWLMQ